MKRRMLTMILLSVITVLSIHVSHRVLEGARVDVTSQRIYSLSEGTRQILDRMNDEGGPAGRDHAVLLRDDGKDAASLHQRFGSSAESVGEMQPVDLTGWCPALGKPRVFHSPTGPTNADPF